MNLATQYSTRVFDATVSVLGSRLAEIVRYQGADAGMIPFATSLLSLVMYANYADSSGRNTEMKSGSETAANWLALFGMVASAFLAFEEYTRIGLPIVPASQAGDISVLAFAQTLSGDPVDVVAYSIPLIAGGIFAMKRIVDVARHRKITG